MRPTPKITAVIFGLLVAATFAAFFVAQRLKHAPDPIQEAQGNQWFSPNGDGYLDVARIRFLVKRADEVTVQIVDHRGDPVRTLLRDRPMGAYRRVPTLVWNGRDDAGRRAADGLYRVRVSLRQEGRTIVVPRGVTLDTTPPRPLVTSIGPRSQVGPELLPNPDGGATIHTLPAGAFGRLLIYKTAPGAPRLVSTLKLAAGARAATWDGHADGRRVSPGTYVAVARWRDRAGNVGASAPLDARGRPVIGYGTTFPGRGGITVRYLEIAPPVSPVAAGSVAPILVDARGACFTWTLRRVGGPVVRRSVRRVCRPPLRLRLPGGDSGVYLLEAHTRRHVASVPIPVQGVDDHRVLVVLPTMTWQGRNPVDDDGDGTADTLDRGLGVRGTRVLQGGRLPVGFSDAEGPLLAFLTRNGKRFDVTTDADLAAGRGPDLSEHTGVVLPGDTRWLTPAAGLALRRWVRGGGKLLQVGLDSLRRSVAVSPRGRLIRPTAPADTDLFGTTLRPVARVTTTVTAAPQDELHLFTGNVVGGTGLFRGFPGYEATESLGPSATLVSSAITDDGRPVITAARFGLGLVIRTGLLRFADRLSSDGNSAQLVLRAWSIIGRR